MRDLLLRWSFPALVLSVVFTSLNQNWHEAFYYQHIGLSAGDAHLHEEILPELVIGESASMRLQYFSEGVVVLRNALHEKWVARLLHVAQHIERDRSLAGRLPTFGAAAGALYSHWQENPIVQDFWFNSGISRLLASVVQAKQLRMFEDLIVTTKPKANWYECWHSDWYSFGNVVESNWSYSIWIPLVDITKESGGSIHLCNRSVIPSNCLSGTAPPVFACEQEGPPGYCEHILEKRCQAPEFRAGDAVIFTKDNVHRTQKLHDPNFRRFAMIGRFVDGQATYRPGSTSFLNSYTYKIMHDVCRHGLKLGDRIAGPCFPQLFPTANATEIDMGRKYVRPLFIAAFALLEKAWYGGNIAH